MSSNNLLARLSAAEGRSGRREDNMCEESWMERERRLFRIYFGMGLAGSGIVGSAVLLTVLALATGPGYERWGWFGNKKPTSALTLYDALPRPASSAATPRATQSDPVWTSPAAAVPAPPAERADEARMQPPFVRVVAVTPVPIKPEAAQAPSPLPLARRARAADAAARPEPKPETKAEAGPGAAPGPATPIEAVQPGGTGVALARVDGAGAEPVKRPDGLLALGGPGTGTPVADHSDRVWWRQIGWGAAALPWMRSVGAAR